MDYPFLDEIEAFEREERQTPVAAGAALFPGSSSIKRWDSLARDFPSTVVINRGFGGSQIEDSIRYAGRIAIP